MENMWILELYSTIRDNKVDASDEPVSFENLITKCPEKYFASC